MPPRGPRDVPLTLTPNLLKGVDAYASAHQISKPEACRELISLGLSSAPLDMGEVLASQRAWEQSRRWCFTKLAGKMREVAAEAEAEFGFKSLLPSSR